MTMDYTTTTTTSSMISKPFATTVQPSNRDIKQQYKHVYNLLKQFEQEKQNITTITDIFLPRIEQLRNSIIDQSTELIYQTEYEVIGRKCREILWFKGYYDLISLAKRLWKNNQTNDKFVEELISNLIIEGISQFKLIIVNLERNFKLDLRNMVDFSFLDSYEKNLYSAVANETKIDCINENRSDAEVTKYAMETIHSFLISLGDLHRYFIDFDFEMPKISKDFAANYYYEAFKLNPKTGMAQNQLGTLMAGINYELDSIYHYLYSMSCPVPFDLSDSRLAVLFQQNSNYLGKQTECEKDQNAIGLRDFIARYLLLVDVFFYDKNIDDFNTLCHCVLLDFRKMLQSNRVDLSSDHLYKMIAIFFFCLVKLKTIGSNKIHSLNAFLVAMCSELVSACSMKLKKFIENRKEQNDRFHINYCKMFDEFETSVRNVREKHKQFHAKTNAQNDEILSNERLSGEAAVIRPKHLLKSTANDAESSGRERESDGKRTPLSADTRNQKRKTNLRRRRRRISTNSNSDLSYFEDSGSDCEMDTDFSTDDESDENDDSWCSSDSDAENNVPAKGDKNNTTHATETKSDSNDDDIIVEDEQIIYPHNSYYNGEQSNGIHQESNVFEDLMANLKQLELFEDEVQQESNTFSFDHSNILNAFDFHGNSGEPSISNGGDSDGNKLPEKLRYKQRYNKLDPNIIIEFFKNDNTMVAIKLLFDWLRANNGIIINCFTSNPEFIDKIFDLINDMNIDIFTRKVYFERRFIEIDDIRENLRQLFDMRQTIPLKEDVLLKEFSVFDLSQRYMDWTIPLKMKITENEETAIRLFMFIDFGFSLCKLKKFNYNFCSRTRKFIKAEYDKKIITKLIRKRTRRNRRRGRNRDRNRKSKKSELSVLLRNDDKPMPSNDVGLEKVDTEKKSNLKKGYLKNRQQANHASTSEKSTNSKPISSEEKHELMGKLWLKHEIEELEAKTTSPKAFVTPYIVIDTKALVNRMDTVKHLVKTRKFVVLIPNAVIAELDDMKKTSEVVRNTTRWLEREIGCGNRFIRLQRNNESKPLTLIKIPRKLDREASTFVQIAQFCYFINESYQTEDSTHKLKALTFVTGDKLVDKKLCNISFTGILDAIGIDFDQINDFYSKYKK